MNKKYIVLIICIFLFSSSIFAINAGPKVCSCPGDSFPCSSATCSPINGFCEESLGLETWYDYNGGCLLDFGTVGYCDYDSRTDCSDLCDDTLGCIECLNSNDCNSDYDYCIGDDRYERDYFCLLFSCTYNNNFIEDCNDDDGNYCNGNLRELRDYGCSGGSCTYSITTTTDCSVFTTSYSDWFCDNSYTSKRTRSLGICDLLKIGFCDTVPDSQSNTCDYGCGTQIFNSYDYKYTCVNDVTYYLYSRDVYGLCFIDNTETFSIKSGPFACSSNTYCENDEIIYTTTPPNPCESYNPTIDISSSFVISGESLTIETISSQTYTPDVVCYDDLNDGNMEVCYGTVCDSSIESAYCNGESCCVTSLWSTVFNIDTSKNIGDYVIKAYMINTVKNFLDIDS